MFTVKATYNNETRKFTLPESSFPSFSAIQSQLYRVFPIRGSYHLSRLMFCPSEGSRVVVGKEVHNEAQYNEHIAPFCGRLWPNGLLRFNVVDEIPHKPPFAASLDPSPFDLPPSPRLARPLPRHPPQTAGSSFMDVDDEWSATGTSNRNSMLSQSTRQSCCSVSEGKEEMKELMSNFLRDFNEMMTSTFGEAPVTPTPKRVPTPPVQAASSSEAVAHEQAEQTEQRNPDDASDVTIPGAFVHPAPSTSVPAPTERVLHDGITCDYCGYDLRGTRFKCHNCPDYDLCEDCVTLRDAMSWHQAVFAQQDDGPLHSFLEITKPGDVASTPRERDHNVLELIELNIPPLSSRPVHSGISCDFCGSIVVGTRHKCLDCPNFDLCDECFPRHEVDHPGHEFVSLETPRRIMFIQVRDGDETPRVHQSSRRAQPTAAHNAICDLCDSRIRGSRYKCLSCPDFDTCSSCHDIVPEHHPRHTFVKLDKPQDLSSRDPHAYKRHSARCNECGETIRGVRYKCLHPECPDYDLCSKCEAMPIEVHPPLHPLVKLRSPDVVIPTVYRVGGTSLIDTPIRQPETIGVAIETDPLPEKTDVSVHANIKGKTSDAAVATTPSILDDEESPERSVTDASVHADIKDKTSDAAMATTPSILDDEESLERSVVMPILPTPPPFMPSMPSELVQQFADLWRDEPTKLGEASNAPKKAMTRSEANDADVPSFPSLFSAFMAKYPPVPKNVLHAVFVSDVNVEDGQVFPPGAEFVKSWRIRNDGVMPWPETTRITFVAGDRMPAFNGAPLSYHVGGVEKGTTVDVNAYDMKAPEIPGKYVGYWRLSDGIEPFGQSVWCEISVPIPSGPSSSGHESLTASEVVMPEPSHARTASIDHPVEPRTPDLVPSTSIPATPTVSAPSTDVDSVDSLLDDFDAASDEEYWEASREHAGGRQVAHHPDAEYVVLYDEQSTDDEGH
ncbi:uncharacterized protein FOMMEDRAFT_167441 [Fomitiporia mediterranea MF3/22]|uniref:uncharacterized protein n=1 Tax=Fomitiporia mediterranea (strain MF3/22) TaxID=694068 RepID=UPI00044091E9|nr:uncharacterized protein FOMMEDRAFT_167441 [Fomitiporia mediterranea MF3/22]EJD04203.1 hypothetical protein FOMMEDRAFT_167441 [Fomitiporia mediterranea MF3/22]